MASENLHAVIIATGQHNILLPKRALAEVTGVMPDAVDDSGSAETAWFCGFVKWHSLRVPVIDFDTLMGSKKTVEASRITILNCVGNALRGTLFGVKSTSFPHITTLNNSAVQPDESESNEASAELILSRVRVGIIQAIIPDMEKLEETVALALPK